MKAQTLARWERRLSGLAQKLPPRTVVSKYSQGRLDFLQQLRQEVPKEPYVPPPEQARVLWGIRFRGPLMNAAGMFKNGECYELAANQGAAAYLGGTGTWNPRRGNEREGIYLPFVAYRKSGAASNWLGLPNDGDDVNAPRAAIMDRVANCPVGWSVMGSPDLEGEERLHHLVISMRLYEQAGVDFLELNESCPNTGETAHTSGLGERLLYVREHFLKQRTRRVPVIVKFSTDTNEQRVVELLDLLFVLGYDGVNFGNSSTAYAERRDRIDPAERRVYDHFTTTFGGGVTGRPLKRASLELAAHAAAYVRAGPPAQEFHVIRTGGIETCVDVEQSKSAGISLNQWFTGYFEAFREHGHEVYRQMFEEK